MDHPLPASHFLVNWGGTRIGFTEVSGLEIGADVIEYREGSFPSQSPIKMPGLKRYGDITMKRGLFADDNEFHVWFATIDLNKVERRDLTISLLNEAHEPVVTWKIVNAWPTKLVGPVLDARASRVAIEELVIACEEIVVVGH